MNQSKEIDFLNNISGVICILLCPLDDLSKTQIVNEYRIIRTGRTKIIIGGGFKLIMTNTSLKNNKFEYLENGIDDFSRLYKSKFLIPCDWHLISFSKGNQFIEINNYTLLGKFRQVILFIRESQKTYNDEQCPICFEDFEKIHILPCLHKFCKSCIMLNKNNKCPLCKKIYNDFSTLKFQRRMDGIRAFSFFRSVLTGEPSIPRLTLNDVDELLHDDSYDNPEEID